MTVTPRVLLGPVDVQVLSAYPLASPRVPRDRLSPLGPRGLAPPDVAAALLMLHLAVTQAGGDLRLTDMFRQVGHQAELRAKYDRWVAAGRPRPGTAGFNPATMKSAYVAKPGYSFHNAARAIDVDIAALRFPGVTADKQLSKFWVIAGAIGWTPVIPAPIASQSEAWHFDYQGPWAPLLARRRDYAEAAMCAALDVGVGEYPRAPERALQAQLHRAGYDVGAVDGICGARTQAALVAAGFNASERDYTKLFALPSSGYR